MTFLRNFAKSVGPVKPVTEACEGGGIVRPREGGFWRWSQLRRLRSPPCIVVRSTMERTKSGPSDWLSHWLTGEPLWRERVNAKDVMCLEKWRYSELSWELSEPMTSIWLVSSRICSKTQYCGQRRRARPAKTCQKIPKKTPLSAESYRRQDWRKYADSRGDPNRSSVAETITRMSKILSELTSQRVMFLKW